MTGEILATLAAFAYGLAGVFIIQGKAKARGDNGVFLSILLTFGMSLCLWVGWGKVAAGDIMVPEVFPAMAAFAVAGVLANVVGRQSMYRATEMVGAVRAGLMRRMTPIFAVPCAVVLLGQYPDALRITGALIVLIGVAIYLVQPAGQSHAIPKIGLVVGVMSALAYALAYCFRGIGLVSIPDAALGASIGALFAAVILLICALGAKGVKAGWAYITIDRSRQHWQTALALSAGQLLQFFALKTASVLSVAVLGTLEVLFCAVFVLVITRCETVAIIRLLIASVVTMGGTTLLFLSP